MGASGNARQWQTHRLGILALACKHLNLLFFSTRSCIGIPLVKWFSRCAVRVPAHAPRLPCTVLLLTCLTLPTLAATDGANLRTLALQRDLVEAELEQLQQTVNLLSRSQGSESPAVQRLAADIQDLKQQLIQLSQREIALLQSELEPAGARDAPVQLPPQPEVMESKPLPASTDYSLQDEADQVTRLHTLLRQHKQEETAAREFEPTAEELALRQAAGRDAERLARIPFSARKVRLSGAEGSAALAQISARLTDPALPESRRGSTPIASVKTYLFGTLIASENRSLQAVGKYHYLARLRLQPGDTTIRMQGHRWEIKLPEDINTTDYLVTLYQPPGRNPELHIFSVEELLAVEDAHLPAWLPRDLGISRAG